MGDGTRLRLGRDGAAVLAFCVALALARASGGMLE